MCVIVCVCTGTSKSFYAFLFLHFYALNTWLGLLLHELLHQCGVALRQSVCGNQSDCESICVIVCMKVIVSVSL